MSSTSSALPPLPPQGVPSLSLSSNSLCSEQSTPEQPPKIQIIRSEDYVHTPWKNGLGETAEIAIHPPTRNFRKDQFVWRLSLSEVRDSCSFSLFPGYDITLFVLPESGANVPLRGNLSALAYLHHNDHATPVAIKPLVPYTYRGEWPTACRMNVSPLKHLTFISNRRVAKVSMSLEAISRNPINGDEESQDHFSDHDDLDLPALDAPAAKALSEPLTPTGPQPSSSSEQDLFSEEEKVAARTSKMLLGNFTIVYVVTGSIQVTVEGDNQMRVLNQGQVLICERDEEAAPTDLTMTPNLKPQQAPSKAPKDFVMKGGLGIAGHVDSSSHDGVLAENEHSTVLIISVHLVGPERQNSIISESPTLTPFITPLAPNLAHPAQPVAAVAAVPPQHGPLPSPIQTQPAVALPPHPHRPTRGRSGSIIVYDDQPAWIVPKELERQQTLTDVGMISPNLATKFWDSAHQYRPPVFSARHQNESVVPPPVVCDSLVIEEFPAGMISTAWINMVKQGLSEWLRVPVIVARGVEPGPVVGITAVVHGNELNGVPCIHRVISDIDVHKLKGTVVAVPCVNVPGYLRFTREFSDGRDLNRLFPGQEHGTASQVYNHNLMVKIINHFNYLIDLHTASFGRVNSYYVRSDMNDSVSAVLAKLQQPQIILHNSGQDGTLRSAASSRGIKAITVEIGNPQLFQNQYVQWSYMGVMRILNYLNMFSSEPVDANLPQPNTILCSKGFWIYTRTGGVLEVYPQVNSIIRKGDLIARIKNIFGNIVDEIYSPSHGVTIGRSSNPVAMAGDRVLHLGIIKKENEVLAKEAKENY
ncbi:hypothetical protein HK105_204505 [Polyrhizophydium stewartii]|uniref:Succinylglutamate desuccinylase/Aspartoacylase catalytic domain-containing protein n=1 Tax=Polyrhizophydium stewartii TaxID=2732419 RepID=A0ABR4N9F2_9FUNG